MTAFSDIAIIFNPNSTGDAKANAAALSEDLRAALPDVPVQLLPTEHAGHAINLAYDFAKQHESPLIISASGDGGYNEVVNGALQATEQGASPITAVLPSGNANDHASSLHDKPLAELITSNQIRQIDALQVAYTDPRGENKKRYAHSYIGIGLTPKVAAELNKEKLNTWKEAKIIVNTLARLRPVAIIVDGKKRYVDSLLCSSIPQMAKVLTVAKASHPQDGLFELTVYRHRNKVALLLWLIKGVVHHLGEQQQLKKFMFAVTRQTAMQLDGELIQLAANTEVTVAVCPGILRTVA